MLVCGNGSCAGILLTWSQFMRAWNDGGAGSKCLGLWLSSRALVF